jgi:putative tryptophan/tyrosine transport system substrate-binding protein
VKSKELGANFNQGAKLMTRKLFGLLFITFLLITVRFAEAQQRSNSLKIGYLANTSRAVESPARMEAFRKGLIDLGYQEGKNFVIESRYAEGDLERLFPQARDLVNLRVDIIVAAEVLAARAATKASRTIPIVLAGGRDPVEAGVVASFARPGGNVTGLTNVTTDLFGKRIDLIKETVPKIVRLSVLLDIATGEGGGTATAITEMQGPASRSGIMLTRLEVKSPKPDLNQAFRELGKNRSQALIISPQSTLGAHRKRIVELATRDRMPTMTAAREWVETGALMSYGVNAEDLYRRAASYVDRIAKGVKPADLPVEAPMKFEFVINLKAAKVLNLTIPQSVLFRADKVIK